MSKVGKSVKTQGRLVVAEGWGGEGMGMTAKGDLLPVIRLLLGVMNMFWN